MDKVIRLVPCVVCAGFVIVILWSQWSSDRMQLKFPINGKYTSQTKELLENKRLVSSIEQFPVSFEIVNDKNFDAYIDLLRNQHSDKTIRDYIARLRFTDQSQQFFRSIETGRKNSFSITLLAHKKVDGHHKILIARISKEVMFSWLDRILSPLKSMLGMTYGEQQQIEAILTSLNQNGNKEIMENLMMTVMAENLRNRLNDHVNIKFISNKNTEF